MKNAARAQKTDLNALLLFAAVAETGGFTAAADQLGVAKAKVSLEIGRLEAQLGVSLFARTTRRVALTDAGQAVFDACVPALRGVQATLAQLGEAEAGTALGGNLRIAATVDQAVQSLAPAIAAFAALHPALQIDLRTSDHVVDMVKEGIDVAIRMGWLRDSSLRATRLAEFSQTVVASPTYLRAHGTPRQPQDLAAHRWVALTLMATPLTWKFTGPAGLAETVRMRSGLRVDSAATLRALLECGAGISVMAMPNAAAAIDAGLLVPLLQDWTLPAGGVFAVYPPGRHLPPQVRAFVDFYAARLKPGPAAVGVGRPGA